MTKSRILLELLVAGSLLSCGMSTAVLGQAAANRSPNDGREKAASDKLVEDALYSRLKAQAEKRQKDWDMSAATTMKSICSNC
jgi:hypothetical protein